MESVLEGYRVLDLSDQKGLMCGMLLADLGADVIKVEKPMGDEARNIGPFYHDEPDPEKSLYWFALNRNKRGITLDIEKADGREIFKRLVKSAHFVIETFPPGHMARLGLGYTDLEKINPGIIVVSLTDWGQDGPYVEKGYKADDMVLWALGGMMWICGDLDRPPVHVSFPQAYFHAGTEAAKGAVTALYYRGMTGEGQHVDVSVQQCLPYILMNTVGYWELNNIIIPRGTIKSGFIPRPDGTYMPMRLIRPCKDGSVLAMFGGGILKAMTLQSIEATKWMAEEGMAEDLEGYDWWSWDTATVSDEWAEHVNEVYERFLMTHTKDELYKEAIKRKIALVPCSDPKDIAEDPQHRARGFFVEIEHPELGDTLTYCGPFAQFSETPMKRWFRAPLIGEHNLDIYEKELGLSRERLDMLKRAGVI